MVTGLANWCPRRGAVTPEHSLRHLHQNPFDGPILPTVNKSHGFSGTSNGNIQSRL